MRSFKPCQKSEKNESRRQKSKRGRGYAFKNRKPEFHY